MIGQSVLHYRILEKLGEGGMGCVYLAEDVPLGRRVALKVLPPQFARDPQRRKRFLQEARAAAKLSHPGIAAVYALEELDEQIYIAFEYVRGETLRALVKPGGLALETLLDVAIRIARALATAHEQGVTHRDLKPENILRTPEGDTKILDFGLARFQPAGLDAETQTAGLTDAGQIVGTVAYMSPEQLEGKEADFRSDVFSFGVLLYELATGTRPFDGANTASTMSRILTAEPPPLAHRNPVAPPELERIVRKCLRKRREERYQSTRDLAVDLENLRRESAEPHAIPAVTAPVTTETGLLERALMRHGSNPRWWWEIDQLGATFVIYPLFGYLGWRAKQELPETWGLWLLVALMLCAAPCIGLRLYLLNNAIFNPRGLGAEVHRVAVALRVASLGYWTAILFMAFGILSEHTDLGPLLLGFALAGVIVVLFIEPSIERTAFPQSDSATSPAKSGFLRRYLDANPRGWWRLNHWLCISGIPVVIYLAWLARGWTQATFGLALFFSVLVLCSILLVLRLYLLISAAFHPGQVAAEVRRIEAWQWRLDLLLMAVLLATAASIAASHTLVAALLAAVAAGGFVGRLVIGPALVRTAFPAEESAGPQPR